jgi:hypothetical protein
MVMELALRIKRNGSGVLRRRMKGDTAVDPSWDSLALVEFSNRKSQQEVLNLKNFTISVFSSDFFDY